MVRHSNFVAVGEWCLDTRSFDCALLCIFIWTNAFNLEKKRGSDTFGSKESSKTHEIYRSAFILVEAITTPKAAAAAAAVTIEYVTTGEMYSLHQIK